MPNIPQMLTVGRLATELGEPVHRIQYILSTRTHIQPAARAGNIRLYRQEVLAAVRRELAAMATARRPWRTDAQAPQPESALAVYRP